MRNLTYQRILVPTDMSDFANQAIRYAALLCDGPRSQITLLYANEAFLPLDVLEVPLGYYLEQAPESKRKLQEKLRGYANEHFPGMNVATLVIDDAPARAIVRTANATQTDLIVMGTHGRHGWRRALLGSVAEAVLHETDRPVLTVTPGILRENQPADIKRVVCPVNFTAIAREALQHASVVAEAFDAELTVVYVAEGMQPPPIPEVEAAFRLWVDPAIRPRVRYRLSVVGDGDPAESVLLAAGDIGADLIVLGAQHKFFSDATVIGTTTQRITRFARCPVLTVMRKAQLAAHSEVSHTPKGVKRFRPSLH